MGQTYLAEKSELFMLRIVEGGYAAMVAHEAGDTPEILRPRPDLFEYSGGYAWGYNGTGVMNLAYAILANCSENIENISSHATRLVENVLSRLDGAKSHDLTRLEILEKLQLN